MKKKLLRPVIGILIISLLIPFAYATYTNGPQNLYYDRDAAADYVYDYTVTPNSDYFNYAGLGGDCTNFASQVLYAGGMAMTQAVSNPSNTDDWYYYSDGVGLGRTPSWTGAHEFRQYWADVNGVGGKHAHQFIKYTAADFDDESTWLEVYNYLEPGDIVQYVRASDWVTYHTQIVHRTSYENGEFKVSMGQHSPFRWVSLKAYFDTLPSDTVICLIKISAPATRYTQNSSVYKTFEYESMSSLGEQLNRLLDSRPSTKAAKTQKWSEVAAIKEVMTERAILSGDFYTAEITEQLLREYIELKIQTTEQLIVSYENETVKLSEDNRQALLVCYETMEKLTELQNEIDATEQTTASLYELWTYFWEDILEKSAPARYVESQQMRGE